MTPQEYRSIHRQRFLEELLDLLRIPSVSADSEWKHAVRDAALFLKSAFEDIGMDRVEIHETKGHPIVYAEKTMDEALPTVLVYGHYDVQPADPLDLWDSPPFEPVIKNERIYARGACDDKGQMYMHLKAVESLEKTTGLPCSVKFMIEGEEEVGSHHLEGFVREHKERLRADVVVISDTAMISNEIPSITVGLRGLSYVEVEVTGPNRDLHSGVYGGAVDNPIMVLSKLIAGMTDERGRITVPGFYDKVLPVSKEERRTMARAPFDLKHYMRALQVDALGGEAGFTTIEKTGIRPSLDVNGIWGGYTGEGAKTVLPAKAYAKISARLVPDQDSREITQLLAGYFENKAPDTVKIKVTSLQGGEPFLTHTDSPGYGAASRAYEEVWGRSPVPTREGGSIPVVALFREMLGLDAIMMGFGLDSDAIHSPNESYGLFNFYKGVETISCFYKHFAALSGRA